MTTVILLTTASPEGVAAARGLLSLLAIASVWAMLFAVRQVAKAVSFLLRIVLVLIATVALGALAVVLLAQLALALGP